MTFQPDPLAVAVAIVLSGYYGDVPALPRADAGPIRAFPEYRSQPFDDSRVTVIADGWRGGDDFFGLAPEAGADPFESAVLREEGVTVLAYGGAGDGPSCESYGGAVSLTAVAPQGGKVYGGGLRCGQELSLPPRGDRICSVKACKDAYGTVLQAKPDAGYELVRWLGSCSASGSDPYCTLSTLKNRKVSAKFRKKP